MKRKCRTNHELAARCCTHAAAAPPSPPPSLVDLACRSSLLLLESMYLPMAFLRGQVQVLGCMVMKRLWPCKRQAGVGKCLWGLPRGPELELLGKARPPCHKHVLSQARPHTPYILSNNAYASRKHPGVSGGGRAHTSRVLLLALAKAAVATGIGFVAAQKQTVCTTPRT